MNIKKTNIFLSIILLLNACLLVYQVFTKDVSKGYSTQGISNNTPNEKVKSSSASNNSLQEIKEITTITTDDNSRNNIANKNTDTSPQNNTVNENTNPKNNTVDEHNDINDAISANAIDNTNTTSDTNSTSGNNASTQNNEVNEIAHIKEDTIAVISNTSDASNHILKSISINSYKSTLTTTPYTINKGDTLSIILRNFEDTCNYKTAIKHIKLVNENINLDELEIGLIINIPTTAITTGKLYKVVHGDTWYKLAKSNYPDYITEDIIDFLISINDLPNSDLPLGENIFLPKL